MGELVNIIPELKLCPVCNGKGFVPDGFYDSTGLTWITSNCATTTCRSCNGKGYIVI